MSTEHQQYSTENQSDVIRDYAAKRGYEIACTYADDGKSGLKMEGRDSLRAMIDDVQSGRANFEAILVYDVSRWGRFQDTDEERIYEYLCKKAGIAVHYCAEQFENDGGPAATIIKSVKRVMAAEYSRELSTKVFQGQCKLIELGYRQGGPAGFGLRRMLIDHTHQQKGILARGEQKSLQTDRVILVRGPEEETRTVQEIYKMFIEDGRCERQIAEILNTRGILTDLGRPWTRGTVREVLTNEKYIGNNVYNRRSFKLKKNRVVNAPDMWVRRDGIFDPIVNPESFYVVRGMFTRTQPAIYGRGNAWPAPCPPGKARHAVQLSDRLRRRHAGKLCVSDTIWEPAASISTGRVSARPGLSVFGNQPVHSANSIPNSLTTCSRNSMRPVPTSLGTCQQTCC